MVLPARWQRVCAVVLSSMLFAASAGAAAPVSPQQAAFSLFQESEFCFRAGDFVGAAELLRKAHALFPEPTLVYNLGRALEGAGDLEGAIDSYTQYLVEERKLIDRGAIERQIATLRNQLEERQKLTAQRQEAEAARREAERQLNMISTARSPSRAAMAAPWILAGVGVLGIAVGGALGGVALSRHNAAVGAPIQVDAASLQSDAHDFAIGTDVAFGVGGALAVAGVIWGIVEVRQRRAARRNVEAPR